MATKHAPNHSAALVSLRGRIAAVENIVENGSPETVLRFARLCRLVHTRTKAAEAFGFHLHPLLLRCDPSERDTYASQLMQLVYRTDPRVQYENYPQLQHHIVVDKASAAPQLKHVLSFSLFLASLAMQHLLATSLRDHEVVFSLPTPLCKGMVSLSEGLRGLDAKSVVTLHSDTDSAEEAEVPKACLAAAFLSPSLH